jgi:hypothetical protein
MQISKISSKATYHKCLKNLHTLGYINYQPSFNPFRGSHVILFNFEQEQTVNNPVTTAPFSKQDSEIAHGEPLTQEQTNNETSYEHVLVPSVNNTNYTNKKNSKNNSEKIKKTESDFQKKDQSKEKIPTKKKVFTEPNLEETLAYFIEQKYPETEARKFYNYFASIGWLVGGKTQMVNWKAAANSWMLNNQNTSAVTNGIGNPVPGNLQTSNENKYDEPL